MVPMLNIEQCSEVISQAAYLDLELTTFGWSHHAHILQPVLDQEELATWEDLLKITLPQDYRQYLTLLGNGGAGPAYGLSKFKLNLDQSLTKPTIFSNEQSTTFNRIAQEWFNLNNEDHDYDLYCQQKPSKDLLSYEEWDELLEQQYTRLEQYLFEQGQLFIANRGCDQDVYLILNGSHQGCCHINGHEYDFSFIPDDHSLTFYQTHTPDSPYNRSIVWEEYLKYLQPFATYYMHYIHACIELCNNLSEQKRQSFDRERTIIRDFLEVIPLKDEAQIVKVLHHLDPTQVSIKSRTVLEDHLRKWLYLPPLFKRYPKQQYLPQAPYIQSEHTSFLLNFYNHLVFKDNDFVQFRNRIPLAEYNQNNTTYPYPTLVQLQTTFYKPA